MTQSDASTIGAPRPCHGHTWRTDADLSARRVRGNTCWPEANRLLYRPGAHREPERQPRIRQGAGTRRRRTAARRDRRTSRPRPRSLPWKTCGNPGLLFVLPSKWPVCVAVPAQLQTALTELAAHPVLSREWWKRQDTSPVHLAYQASVARRQNVPLPNQSVSPRTSKVSPDIAPVTFNFDYRL
jgi:hypothetical protein